MRDSLKIAEKTSKQPVSIRTSREKADPTRLPNHWRIKCQLGRVSTLIYRVGGPLLRDLLLSTLEPSIVSVVGFSWNMVWLLQPHQFGGHRLRSQDSSNFLSSCRRETRRDPGLSTAERGPRPPYEGEVYACGQSFPHFLHFEQRLLKLAFANLRVLGLSGWHAHLRHQCGCHPPAHFLGYWNHRPTRLSFRILSLLLELKQSSYSHDFQSSTFASALEVVWSGD